MLLQFTMSPSKKKLIVGYGSYCRFEVELWPDSLGKTKKHSICNHIVFIISIPFLKQCPCQDLVELN